MNIAVLKEHVTLPSSKWIDVSPPSNEMLSVCKVVDCSKLTHCITINYDNSWDVFIHGRKILPSCCTILKTIPTKIHDSKAASQLLELVNSSTICCGNSDDNFVSMISGRKGENVVSSDGSVAAYLDDSVEVNHLIYYNNEVSIL